MSRARFLQDLGELLVFGTGLWGLISILSILLPIANIITETIPLRSDVMALGTSLAVIASFFALTYSFTEKSQILEFELRRPFFRGEIINPRRDMLHNSVARFAWGLISLTSYVMLMAVLSVLEGNADEAAKWLVPIIKPLSVIFYALAFALVTGAFSSLAVMQHTRPRAVAANRGSVNLGIHDEIRTVAEEPTLSNSPDGVGDSQHQN